MCKLDNFYYCNKMSVLILVGSPHCFDFSVFLNGMSHLIFLAGLDDHSWGLSYKGTIWEKGKYKKYCEPFYDKDTKIGILLNLYQGTLTFFKNGINLGVAFNGMYCTPPHC